MKLRIVFVFLFIGILILPVTSVYASAHINDSIYVMASDEVIDDNVYAFAESVDIQGTIKGDLIVAAGIANIKGVVEGDIIIAGGEVTIGGVVGGDIRILAGNLQIDSEISGNVLGASGEVIISDDTVIGHSLTVATGVLRMNGSVAKNILATGGLMNINGNVAGNVMAYTDGDGGIILGSDSRIGGDVRYASVKQIQRLSGAEVAGVIQKIDNVGKDKRDNKKDLLIGLLIYKIFTLLALSVVGFIFIRVFPNISKGFHDKLNSQAGATLLYGFAIFFLIPIAAFLILITIIGIPLTFLTLALFMVSLYISKVVMAIAIGVGVLKKLTKKDDVSIDAGFFTGAILITIISIIPFIGPLLSILIMWWGLGILFVVIHSAHSGKKDNEK